MDKTFCQKIENNPQKSDESQLIDHNNIKLSGSYLFQYFVAFSATLLMIAGGTSNGWASPILPKLMANDSYIHITSDESSWIITTSIAGTTLGTFPAAWLMDRFGRKNAMLACAGPYIIGWVLIGIATSKLYLFVGKFFLGFGFGWSISVIPVYLGEIASDQVRGFIGSLVVIMNIVGILYAYSIGPYVSISSMAWLCMIPVILFFITFIWLPESPYYLLGRKNPAKAEQSLSRLRQCSDVQAELNKMTIAIHLSQHNKGKLKELFNQNNRYRLFLTIGLVMSLHLTGNQAILSNTETIFRNMKSSIDPSHASIIFVSFQLVSASLSSLVMDTWGRRPLFLSSLTAIGICNLIIGIFFLLVKLNYDVSQVTWIPVVTLMSFIVFYILGVGSVPFILLGEIFPKNIKSIAAIVFVMTGALAAMITVKCFQIVSDNLGNEYAFLGFAIISFIFLPIFGYFLPETKGKSLDQILIEFSL